MDKTNLTITEEYLSTKNISDLGQSNSTIELPVNDKENSALTDTKSTDNEEETSIDDTASPTTSVNKRNDRLEKSIYVEELDFIREGRDNVTRLEILDMKGFQNETEEVSLHYRCLIECLLTFSEMRIIKLNDLKEVCNAFTKLIQSRSFNFLEGYYPFSGEIRELRGNIRTICLQADQNQPFNFRLKKDTKQDLLVSRWELANYVPKRSFNELDFDEL